MKWKQGNEWPWCCGRQICECSALALSLSSRWPYTALTGQPWQVSRSFLSRWVPVGPPCHAAYSCEQVTLLPWDMNVSIRRVQKVWNKLSNPPSSRKRNWVSGRGWVGISPILRNSEAFNVTSSVGSAASCSDLSDCHCHTKNSTHSP